MFPLLVDSNIYIRLLRRQRDPVTALFEHFDTLNLVTCGMVRLEVLRGVRQPRARARLDEFFSVMQYVEADARLWQDALALTDQCSERGFMLHGPDAVIAASALRKQAALLTDDADFTRVPGLQVLPLPDAWR